MTLFLQPPFHYNRFISPGKIQQVSMRAIIVVSKLVIFPTCDFIALVFSPFFGRVYGFETRDRLDTSRLSKQDLSLFIQDEKKTFIERLLQRLIVVTCSCSFMCVIINLSLSNRCHLVSVEVKKRKKKLHLI